MATVNFTSLLGLALPTSGDLSGTWGDEVNDKITSLLDSAVAGATPLTTDANVTLTTTTGAANTARQAILLCTGARTGVTTITAPAASKLYVVINATTGGHGVKIVGAGPTTGITIATGDVALVAWNGSDFVFVGAAVSAPQTLLNKTLNLTSNTLSGTKAQFNTACSDGDFVYTDAIGVDVQAYDADTLKADTADNLTAGFTATDYNAGTKSTGTFTPDPALGNFQYAVNGGAHTLAPPAASCTMIIQYTNNGSAGTITTSGFTKVTGTAPTTTNTHKFLAFITRCNSNSHLAWQALQ
jgi:hypothetical protein